MIVNRKDNIFNDGIAYVEQYDFGLGNLSHENRVAVVTQVASICYGNDKTIGSETLYNKLERESLGLPSSSFEFVPVLVPMKILDNLSLSATQLVKLHMFKLARYSDRKMTSGVKYIYA